MRWATFGCTWSATRSELHVRGGDQTGGVLPELPSRLPVADQLRATHPKGLEADPRQRKEVVGLLGLGLAAQDLAPGPLDLVIHVDLTSKLEPWP